MRTSIIVIAGCAVAVLVGLLVLASGQHGIENGQTKGTEGEPRIGIPQISGLSSGVTFNTPAPALEVPGPLSPSTVLQRPAALDPLSSAVFASTMRRAQGPGGGFERFEAISELGYAGGASAELVLIDMLTDPDPEIRETVVEALGQIGTPEAAEGLGYALNDADPLVRRTAIELLAEMGTRDALAALAALAAALNDPAPDLRQAAVYELADNPDPAALALLQRFLSDGDSQVQELAAEFLGNEQGP